MSLYYRNLKRIGICMILVAVGDLVYEMLGREYLVSQASPYAAYIPLPWGIWSKNLIGVASGLLALLIYRNRWRPTAFTLVMVILCVAEVAVTVLSMTGTLARRIDGIVDITMLMMVLLFYTLSQTDRNNRQWNGIRSKSPATLDLRLAGRKAFFDPIQLGPKMAIRKEYAERITRYVSSMRDPSPLQINLFCTEPVSEAMQDMMQEVLEMHYQTEEDRISKNLEKRYTRVMLLTSVSVCAVAAIQMTLRLGDGLIVWEIIGNFAAFGLWQIGYTHYERNEAYDELLGVQIAKNARIRVVERQASLAGQEG